MNEVEFDEFEKLLGEIPSATSGNPNSDESGANNFSEDLKVVSLERTRPPVCINSSNKSVDDKLLSNGCLTTAKVSNIKRDEENLPDDQSLTSAFTELSFKDGVGIQNSVTHSVPKATSYLLNGQFPNTIKNHHHPSTMDPRLLASNGFGAFDLKKQQPNGYSQQTENFSGAVPLPQGFHLLSNGVEYPVIPNQQQFFMEAPPPYLHPPQLSQPHITWRHVEEEHYYRMHQQYLYLQQLRNQQVQPQHPSQDNGNFVRFMNKGIRQPCHQKPVAYHVEQEPFWNKTMISRSTNQLPSGFSSADVDNARALNHQVGKQNFPEKILTRANGLNSIRSVKFGSFGGNEPIANINQNGKMLPNGYCNNHAVSPVNVGLQMDNLSSRGSSSPDMFDFKHNKKSLTQRFNSLDEFTGRIYLMAKDQHGCRFLQRKFAEGTRDDVDKIFQEIIVHIVELMTDPFGNYLVQKLLEVCNDDQQMQILHSITRKAGDLVRISCDMHGFAFSLSQDPFFYIKVQVL